MAKHYCVNYLYWTIHLRFVCTNPAAHYIKSSLTFVIVRETRDS